MGLSHSPSIVTDGLVLCLDAANRRSYPGSGTSWLDLSGNSANGTLINGFAFSSDVGGCMVFDQTNEKCYLSATRLNVGHKWTMMCWYYPASSGDDIMGFSGYGPYWGYTIKSYNSRPYIYYQDSSGNWIGGGGIYTASGTATLNSWNHCAITFDNGTYASYMNGFKFYNGSGLALTGFNYGSGQFNLGLVGWSTNALKYSNAQVYNRALTADEVRRNYLATKSRFGL